VRCLGNQAAADHNYARGGQRQLYSPDGQAMVSSRRNRDIKEQKTGVDLALKLWRSQLRQGAGSRQGLYSTALNQPR
jgi:hypothetical protein